MTYHFNFLILIATGKINMKISAQHINRSRVTNQSIIKTVNDVNWFPSAIVKLGSLTSQYATSVPWSFFGGFPH